MTPLEPGTDGVGSPCTVVVSAALSVSPATVWQALTEPEVVRQWFGKLSPALTQGGSTRLDFEDGDFFDIFDIELQPTGRVHYKWSFLGTSPPDSITWRILPEDIGCVVAVIDADPERSREWMGMLKEGWMDFVQRLTDHLRTGQNTRYDWRRDFDGSIELPGTLEEAWRNLLADERIKHWASFLSAGLSPNSECRPGDGAEPVTACVANVAWEAPKALTFDIIHDKWAQATSVAIRLNARRNGTMLSVNHVGWESLQADPTYGGRQRRRFADLWIDALWRAKNLMTESQRLETDAVSFPAGAARR
jgi:uncharacterized protein YndB with AHSA1/START domain